MPTSLTTNSKEKETKSDTHLVDDQCALVRHIEKFSKIQFHFRVDDDNNRWPITLSRGEWITTFLEERRNWISIDRNNWQFDINSAVRQPHFNSLFNRLLFLPKAHQLKLIFGGSPRPKWINCFSGKLLCNGRHQSNMVRDTINRKQFLPQMRLSQLYCAHGATNNCVSDHRLDTNFNWI